MLKGYENLGDCFSPQRNGFHPEPADVAEKVTPFSTAQNVFRDTSALSDRINAMVNRLVGETNEVKAEKNNLSPQLSRNSGILNDLDDGAHGALRAIERAHVALDRLDREI